MDLFNSYRDPFLYDEEGEDSGEEGIDNDSPSKIDPDLVDPELEEEGFEAPEWEEDR